jgi:hypothetical protein
MTYAKPIILAENSAEETYSAGCPADQMSNPNMPLKK